MGGGGGKWVGEEGGGRVKKGREGVERSTKNENLDDAPDISIYPFLLLFVL